MCRHDAHRREAAGLRRPWRSLGRALHHEVCRCRCRLPPLAWWAATHVSRSVFLHTACCNIPLLGRRQLPLRGTCCGGMKTERGACRRPTRRATAVRVDELLFTVRKLCNGCLVRLQQSQQSAAELAVVGLHYWPTCGAPPKCLLATPHPHQCLQSRHGAIKLLSHCECMKRMPKHRQYAGGTSFGPGWLVSILG